MNFSRSVYQNILGRVIVNINYVWSAELYVQVQRGYIITKLNSSVTLHFILKYNWWGKCEVCLYTMGKLDAGHNFLMLPYHIVGL